MELQIDHNLLRPYWENCYTRLCHGFNLCYTSWCSTSWRSSTCTGSCMYIADTFSRAYVPGDEDKGIGHGSGPWRILDTQCSHRATHISGERHSHRGGNDSHKAVIVHISWLAFSLGRSPSGTASILADPKRETGGRWADFPAIETHQSIRADVLSRSHEGHVGMVKIKSRAAKVMFGLISKEFE